MNSYELIMKDIKATISKYLECKMIVNPLFAEKSAMISLFHQIIIKLEYRKMLNFRKYIRIFVIRMIICLCLMMVVLYRLIINFI